MNTNRMLELYGESGKRKLCQDKWQDSEEALLIACSIFGHYGIDSDEPNDDGQDHLELISEDFSNQIMDPTINEWVEHVTNYCLERY